MDQLGAIRAFVRVVEAGSFAKAADTMGAPRSTVSKLVQDLEASLSLKLLERTTRSVTVTGGALVPIMTDWAPPRYPVHIVRPAGRFPSVKYQVFADWVAGVFSAYDRDTGTP
ncbi:LysR family transcriptional regulator [Rhizobium sp. R693]|uniref:LysR family transcriptional regulator n=1 Tax=Rhizobium sp. R693 TaxID=1764276 RepID=UPI000B530708|nr:LysR family transcriptional regulator [Rhizobium sp. R693]OWV82924.1 hypothetical protein ATY79_16215 [Rhizobium sp. R693]